MRIRLAKEQDLPPLANLYCKVYTHFDVGEQWDEDSAFKLLKYWFNRQPDLSFVAEENGKLLGAFFCGIKPWWDGNHLDTGEIFIDPDHQGKGIGSELSKTVYSTAIDKYNAVYFETHTFKKSKFPLSWYKKQGFEEIDGWILIGGDVRKLLSNLEK